MTPDSPPVAKPPLSGAGDDQEGGTVQPATFLPGSPGPGNGHRRAARRSASRTKRRPWGALVATLSSTALICSPTAASAATVRGGVALGALTTATGGCALPVTTDPYDGFRVGVPSGWDVSTLDGEIAVTENVAGTEGALLYPAFLTKGTTAKSLFSSFMNHERKVVAGGGGTLSYTLAGGPQPSASLDIHQGGTERIGRATVLVLPLRTAVSSQVGVFFAYWAPRARYSADAGTLAAIGRCYAPERAELFQVFRDKAFTYILPPGWVPYDETSDALDLHGYHNDADVSYLFFGPLEQGVNVSQPVNSPQAVINYLFGQSGIHVTQVLSEVTSPVQQEANGAAQSAEYLEFTATVGGKAVHGLVYVETTVGTTTSGVERIGLSTTNLWDSVNGGLIEMMGSVQHKFIQDLRAIQAANQEWQDFSGQVANFDDTLNSQQLVQDPSTRGYYEAPYSSWDPNGPNGPGYYLPNGQELNPVQRP